MEALVKLLTYHTDQGLKLGILEKGRVTEASISVYDFYRQGLDALPILQSHQPNESQSWPEQELKFAPVVPNPGKILCVGLNYRQHAKESGMAEPAYPVLFSKFNNSLAAAMQPIPISPVWKQVDYESELAVVIGKMAVNVDESDALSYVLGYCCANDLSERELQFRSGQWLLGKSLDGFLPLGPYLVTADEISDPQDLWIRGWYNGELRQDSTTADMIFSVAEIIAYVSRYMTLFPGDVILTGTPEGVIFGKDVKSYMKPGDTYRVEIEKLGRLENNLVEASS
jgi:2-keto-4-pentenoate hydratase/2-oxohepta-3-ene-1,7-dioic acid hydratase in catechol pathway